MRITALKTYISLQGFKGLVLDYIAALISG